MLWVWWDFRLQSLDGFVLDWYMAPNLGYPSLTKLVAVAGAVVAGADDRMESSFPAWP